MSKIHTQDLDMRLIRGRGSVVDDFARNQRDQSREVEFFGLKVWAGTVIRVNTSESTDRIPFTVDVQLGEVQEGIPGREYINCPIVDSGTEGDAEELDGEMHLPKNGARVAFAFIGGFDSQPLVLGVIKMPKNEKAKQDLDTEKETEGLDYTTDRYYRNGSLREFRLNSGKFRRRNDNGSYTMDADGNHIFNDGEDYGVRYNELKKAFDQLKSDFDALVDAYNAHIHTTTATIGPGPTVGVIAPTTSSGAKTTADISHSKVEELRVTEYNAAP